MPDRDGEALATALGASAKYVHLDVTKPEDWEAAIATAVKTYGVLNVLVNNAGIANYGPIDQYSRADWDKIVAVNLTGVFNGIQRQFRRSRRRVADRSSTCPPLPACAGRRECPATSRRSSRCAG